MLRKAILVIVAALATTAAAASTNPPPSNGQPSTPPATLSDVNTFGGAGVAHPHKPAAKYAQAMGQSNNDDCHDSQGNTTKCGGGPVDPNSSGDNAAAVIGTIAIVGGLALYLTSGGGSSGKPISP